MLSLGLIIFLIDTVIFNKIKCEEWWDEVIDYDIEDHNFGYAGTSNQPMIDFYLCSNKKYRAHYKGDDPLTWSKNFSNCDPVGIGREIDGICIYSDRKSYRGRLYLGSYWMRVIKECNISDQEEGFVGQLGSPLACLAINGRNYYRMSSLTTGAKLISSNPKNASDRIVSSLFGDNIINEANYDNEYDLDLSSKFTLFKVKIQLFNNTNIDLDGDGIKFIFYWEKIYYADWERENVNHLMVKRLKEILNFDINEERKIFEIKIVKDIIHGILIIHTFYDERRIQIDIGDKITDEYKGYRGGIKLNFYLNNSEKLIETIKNVVELIARYITKENRKDILEKLKVFNNLEQLGQIIKLISPYDTLFTQIILLYILKNS